MQAHSLSLHTPSNPGMGQKVKLFLLKVLMLHIKLKGMENRAPCKHITCPYVSLGPWGEVKRSKYFF